MDNKTSKAADFGWIGLVIIIAAIIVGNAYTYKFRAENIITVTGLGETEFESDQVVWRGTITAENSSAAGGYAEIEKSKAAVTEFITSRGIPADAVDFMFVNVNKTYEGIYSANGNYAGQRFTGYQLSQEFVVESTDLDAVETVSRDISMLIAEGVQMDLWQPAYYFSDLDGLKLDVIEQATKDGRERAERIAGNAGGKLKRLKKATIGVFQITGANTDEEFTAGGSFNTSSRSKKARITVRLEYRVK